MKQILQSIIGVLIILQSPLGRADFLSDRCYAKPLIFFDSKIKRLYIGKEKTNKCLGFTVEQCVKRLGEPSKTETVSDHEKRLTFYGTKRLYRGTGIANKSIGPEWREMRVIDGKIVDEYSMVQILEFGYSWMIDERTLGADEEYSCELYGKCGVLVCFRLTPVGPIPRLPERPKLARNYTNEELFSFYFQLVTLGACDSLSDEYRRRSAGVLSKWRKSEPNLLLMFEKNPEYPIDLTGLRAKFSKNSPEQSKEAKTYCENVLYSIKKTIEGPDTRFSSPEKTWALFMASLKKGDRDTAVVCLTGNARRKLTPLFNSLTKPQLKEMAESFTGFEMTQRTSNYQEAVTARSNGRAGFVYFVESGGEWKISEM